MLYNYLYNLICERLQPSQFSQKRDRERATEVVPRFLGTEKISNYPRIRTCAGEIKDTVEKGPFYVRGAMWDKERARRLEFTNSEEWAKSVLDILYQIRCNLFHGSKPFSEDQRVILIPCIHILETINDLLIKEIAPGQQHLK